MLILDRREFLAQLVLLGASAALPMLPAPCKINKDTKDNHTVAVFRTATSTMISNLSAVPIYIGFNHVSPETGLRIDPRSDLMLEVTSKFGENIRFCASDGDIHIQVMGET